MAALAYLLLDCAITIVTIVGFLFNIFIFVSVLLSKQVKKKLTLDSLLLKEAVSFILCLLVLCHHQYRGFMYKLIIYYASRRQGETRQDDGRLHVDFYRGYEFLAQLVSSGNLQLF